jgi:hypothetical protein
LTTLEIGWYDLLDLEVSSMSDAKKVDGVNSKFRPRGLIGRYFCSIRLLGQVVSEVNAESYLVQPFDKDGSPLAGQRLVHVESMYEDEPSGGYLFFESLREVLGTHHPKGVATLAPAEEVVPSLAKLEDETPVRATLTEVKAKVESSVPPPPSTPPSEIVSVEGKTEPPTKTSEAFAPPSAPPTVPPVVAEEVAGPVVKRRGRPPGSKAKKTELPEQVRGYNEASASPEPEVPVATKQAREVPPLEELEAKVQKALAAITPFLGKYGIVGVNRARLAPLDRPRIVVEVNRDISEVQTIIPTVLHGIVVEFVENLSAEEEVADSEVSAAAEVPVAPVTVPVLPQETKPVDNRPF